MQVGGATPFRLTADSADDCCAAWSPDGREIAFIHLKGDKATILAVGPFGGTERKLVDLPDFTADEGLAGPLTWAPDGKRLAFPYKRTEMEHWSIYSLSLDTLGVERLTTPPASSYGDFLPAISPDGGHLGFVRAPSVAAQDIYVMPLSGGEPRRLTTDGRNIHGICWTSDSREILFSEDRTGITTLWRILVSGGSPKPIQGVGEDAFTPRISAKGDHLAYVKESLVCEIYRMDLTGADKSMRTSKKLIASSRFDGSPWISPDGSRIAFESDRSGRMQIWTCYSDGTRPVQLTNLNADSVGSPSWSPDGQSIAFDSTLAGNSDIFVINLETRQLRPLTRENSEDVVPTWSRDGRWIYFGSNRSGSWRIWKTPPDGGEAVGVTRDGGVLAYESVDGKFVYFAKVPRDTRVWRIPVAGGPEEVVLEGVPGYFAWALTERGIYFRKDNTESALGALLCALRGSSSMEFFDLANKQTTRIALVSEGFVGWFGPRWLSVSPDGKWLAHSAKRPFGDIMMVENFR